MMTSWEHSLNRSPPPYALSFFGKKPFGQHALSPRPITHVSETTIIFSSNECQCGGTFKPSRCLTRITRGDLPSLGSPERIGIPAPSSNGCHSMASGFSETRNSRSRDIAGVCLLRLTFIMSYNRELLASVG